MEIKISRAEEERLKGGLEQRSDIDAMRMKRYLAMPDLSRTPGNPLYELVQRIRAIPDFKAYDVIEVPEIMGTDIVFDLFDFPRDHPARSESDSYFIDDTHVLRTHTTVMWYYWLKEETVRKRIAAGEATGALSFKLCADFNTESRGNQNFYTSKGPYDARLMEAPVPAGGKAMMQDNWSHGMGTVCFDRTIDPSFYPPLNKVQP